MHGEEAALFIAALTFLAAAVISVPVAKRLGFSPVVGYLLVGIALGPVGLNVADPATISTVAEFGVVLLLFLIGLELKPSSVIAMGHYIFGLGAAQLALSALIFTLLAYYGLGFSLPAAIVAAIALSVSGTAIALNLLGDRGDLGAPYGQRVFSVLLFQDIAVVPLLALVPLLGPGHPELPRDTSAALMEVGIAVAAIAAIVLCGRYLLNPLFRILARSGAREAMTAAALLVVLGAAGLMEAVGLSMALGAFLAGLLLSESTFRHELEANVEAFRGLLLAAFFMSVGMSLNVMVVMAHLGPLLLAMLVVCVVKTAVVYGVFRADRIGKRDALRAGLLMIPAGEFAFVLFPLSLDTGIFQRDQSDLLIALAALTMMAGPMLFAGIDVLLRRLARNVPEREADDFSDAEGAVLVIGFGRFGQIVSQSLLAEGMQVTIIDKDVGMIQSAGRFGVHIYYGDGTRLDVLRAAGAEGMQVICVCVDHRADADRIVDMVKASMPRARLFVRSFDRVHAMDLRRKGVAYEIRETLESALAFSGRALEALGLSHADASARVADVRERDKARLMRQIEEADAAEPAPLVPAKAPPKLAPDPLVAPEKPARPLSGETEDILTHQTEFSG